MQKTIIAIALGVALIGTALPAFAETTAVRGSAIGQLQRGAKGDAVKLLQALLAADPTIYPEGLVTGNYGALTAAAVARFQKKHGLDQVGNVGPKTLRELDNDLSTASTTL